MVTRVLVLICLSFQLGSFAIGEEERSKKIDFDGSVVEGLNKKPLDSLSHIADPNSKHQIYLYHRKKTFQFENQQSLRELELTQ